MNRNVPDVLIPKENLPSILRFLTLAMTYYLLSYVCRYCPKYFPDCTQEARVVEESPRRYTRHAWMKSTAPHAPQLSATKSTL